MSPLSWMPGAAHFLSLIFMHFQHLPTLFWRKLRRWMPPRLDARGCLTPAPPLHVTAFIYPSIHPSIHKFIHPPRPPSSHHPSIHPSIRPSSNPSNNPSLIHHTSPVHTRIHPIRALMLKCTRAYLHWALKDTYMNIHVRNCGVML